MNKDKFLEILKKHDINLVDFIRYLKDPGDYFDAYYGVDDRAEGEKLFEDFELEVNGVEFITDFYEGYETLIIITKIDDILLRIPCSVSSYDDDTPYVEKIKEVKEYQVIVTKYLTKEESNNYEVIKN